MKLNELCEIAYRAAQEKGWYEPGLLPSPLERHMLMVSELAEATEKVRKGEPPMYFIDEKPEGELIELADVLIRIADYCGFKGWDLEKAVQIKLDYNKTSINSKLCKR